MLKDFIIFHQCHFSVLLMCCKHPIRSCSHVLKYSLHLWHFFLANRLGRWKRQRGTRQTPATEVFIDFKASFIITYNQRYRSSEGPSILWLCSEHSQVSLSIIPDAYYSEQQRHGWKYVHFVDDCKSLPFGNAFCILSRHRFPNFQIRHELGLLDFWIVIRSEFELDSQLKDCTLLHCTVYLLTVRVIWPT